MVPADRRRSTPCFNFALLPMGSANHPQLDDLADGAVVLLRGIARRMRRLPPPTMCVELKRPTS